MSQCVCVVLNCVSVAILILSLAILQQCGCAWQSCCWRQVSGITCKSRPGYYQRLPPTSALFSPLTTTYFYSHFTTSHLILCLPRHPPRHPPMYITHVTPMNHQCNRNNRDKADSPHFSRENQSWGYYPTNTTNTNTT